MLKSMAPERNVPFNLIEKMFGGIWQKILQYVFHKTMIYQSFHSDCDSIHGAPPLSYHIKSLLIGLEKMTS